MKNLCSADRERYLRYFLSASDYRHFTLMSGLLNSDSNILFVKDNEPYTMETLSEVLGLSMKRTRALIHRLMVKGLVVLVMSAKTAYKGELIWLYPYDLLEAIEREIRSGQL